MLLSSLSKSRDMVEEVEPVEKREICIKIYN